MSEQEYETADNFVPADEAIPHPVQGALPLYEDHPPDTWLPMQRCPECGETVSIKDIWRLYKRRERLLELQQELHHTSDEYHAYQKGIRDAMRNADTYFWALNSKISSWVRKQVEPRFWDSSDLNPKNAGANNE